MALNPACQALCDALGARLVARDFEGVHALLAPWLQSATSPAELRDAIDAAGEGLAHPPRSWTADEGLVGLEDLRKPDPYGPPSRPLPAEITPGNFRGWLSIQLAPEAAVHEEQNVCFDVWLVAVEHEGSLRVGYLEPWEAT